MRHELLMPEAAARDQNSREMARVWIAERGLHCALRIGMYEDREDVREEKAWAIMLADMARHVARGLSQRDGMKSEPELLAEIRDLFARELADPTSDICGGFSRPGHS